MGPRSVTEQEWDPHTEAYQRQHWVPRKSETGYQTRSHSAAAAPPRLRQAGSSQEADSCFLFKSAAPRLGSARARAWLGIGAASHRRRELGDEPVTRLQCEWQPLAPWLDFSCRGASSEVRGYLVLDLGVPRKLF